MGAVSFPLAPQDLVDRMMVETAVWSLSENQELSGTGEGEWIAADLGPRLWTAEVSTIAADIETVERLRARFNLLDGAIQSFYLYDPRRPMPATDPTGAALAGHAVTISAIAGNRKEITFAGLPAGFTVPEGCMFSVTAGAAPRTYLGQLAGTVVASGAGVAGPVEVRPHLRPWVMVGQPVALIKPVAKVKLVPKSQTVQQVTAVLHRLRFSARQTLAAG